MMRAPTARQQDMADLVANEDPRAQAAATAGGAAPGAGGEDDLWGAGESLLPSDGATGPGATGTGYPERRLQAAFLLRACTQEAARLAAAMAALDTEIGKCLVLMSRGPAGSQDAAVPDWPVDPPPIAETLQGVDILRQELEGFARVLEIVSAHVTCRGEVETEVLGRVLPLAAQRTRLLSLKS
mgnify:CR=1 FL=1